VDKFLQLENGQIASIHIETDELGDSTITAGIFDTPEDAQDYFESPDASPLLNVCTGKCGLKGLSAIKRLLDEFIANQPESACVSLAGSDEVRQRVYWRTLSRDKKYSWSLDPVCGFIWIKRDQNFCWL